VRVERGYGPTTTSEGGGETSGWNEEVQLWKKKNSGPVIGRQKSNSSILANFDIFNRIHRANGRKKQKSISKCAKRGEETSTHGME